MAKLHVGDPAPDFELIDQSGATVRSADVIGKSAAVLIFYPADHTPGCTKQLCTARDDAARYRDAGIAVFGVNNGSAESHRKFIAKYKLAMPLLVDADLETAKRYGAVTGFGPVRFINRTVVGIARDGTIAFYRRGMPSTADIVSAVAERATAPLQT